MRKLKLVLFTKRTCRELQFYEDNHRIGVSLVTFENGTETKRQNLGETYDYSTLDEKTRAFLEFLKSQKAE